MAEINNIHLLYFNHPFGTVPISFNDVLIMHSVFSGILFVFYYKNSLFL